MFWVDKLGSVCFASKYSPPHQEIHKSIKSLFLNGNHFPLLRLRNVWSYHHWTFRLKIHCIICATLNVKSLSHKYAQDKTEAQGCPWAACQVICVQREREVRNRKHCWKRSLANRWPKLWKRELVESGKLIFENPGGRRERVVTRHWYPPNFAGHLVLLRYFNPCPG